MKEDIIFSIVAMVVILWMFSIIIFALAVEAIRAEIAKLSVNRGKVIDVNSIYPQGWDNK
jgi:hypothetical protein